MMKISILRTEKEYEAALERADNIFNAVPGTAEGEEFELLLLVIKDYEDKFHQVLPPEPLAAIRLSMEERGVKAKDLVPYIGSKSYVSLMLNGKKPLTVQMMKVLHKMLGIPAEVLLG